MTRRWRRRQLIRAGATIGAATLAGCSGLLGDGTTTSVDGWPMYQRGPTHTGAVEGDDDPGTEFRSQWKTTALSLAEAVADDVPQAYLSKAAISDGTVYVLLASPVGGIGLDLIALADDDGTVEWRTTVAEEYLPTNGAPPQPTVIDDRVLVSHNGFGDAAGLIAVDTESGDVQWRDESELRSVTSATARDGTYAVGSETAYAVDPDGTTAWEFADGERPPLARSEHPPTVTDDAVYVPTARTLQAFDHGGTRQWSRELTFESDLIDVGTNPRTPVVGDALYVTTANLRDRADGRLLALDPEDGSTQWEFKPDFDPERRERMIQELREERGRTHPFGVGVYTPPALYEGTLYVPGFVLPAEIGPASDPKLFAVDAASGEREWATDLPESFGLAPPVVSGGTVYLATNGGVVAVDANGGQLLATGPEPETYVSALATVGERLYVSSPASITAVGPN